MMKSHEQHQKEKIERKKAREALKHDAMSAADENIAIESFAVNKKK